MTRKYFPDVATMRRATDPTKRKDDRRKALANLDRPTPADFVQSPAPSPWAGDATADLDPAALPSAMSPPATEEPPVTKAAPAEKTARRFAGVPRSWKIVGGFACIAVAAPLAAVLAGRLIAPSAKPAATATSAMPLPAAPSMDAIAAPLVTAATAATAAPSAAPAVTATPSATPTGKSPPTRRGAAPAPVKTAAPAVTAEPAATATPTAEATPRPPPSVFISGDRPEL